MIIFMVLERFERENISRSIIIIKTGEVRDWDKDMSIDGIEYKTVHGNGHELCLPNFP